MRNLFNLLVTLLLFTSICSSCTREYKEESTEFRHNIDRYIEYWNTGKFDDINNVLSEDFELRMTPQFEPEKGIEAFKEGVLYWRRAYPDFYIIIDEIIYSANAAAIRWTITATNTGSGTHPPTGRSIKVPGMSIIHFSEGKIKDEWIASNNYFWLQQLGYTLVAPDSIKKD